MKRRSGLSGVKAVLVVVLAVFVVCLLSCGKKADMVPGTAPGHKKIQVVASLFPLYDFAKHIGGERAEVSLLLPPGVEPHSFEPKPGDIVRINKADLFVYTNDSMEPWVHDMLKGIDNRDLLIVDSSKYVRLIKEEDGEEEPPHGGEALHRHGGMDPHIWLDFTNAAKMVDALYEGFIKKDPAHSEFYRQNAELYKAKLLALDKKYSESLSDCKKRTFINGGHFAFGYLARRYRLHYLSAYGVSPDAEPNPKDLIALSSVLRRNGIHYIFYEEIISPRIAETISRETGAKLLMLNGAHNISRDELNRGVTFLAIMEHNLENLKVALECR